MWRLLRRWRARRKIEQARLIFEYFDGQQWRYGDPFALWRALVNHETFNLTNHLPAVDRGEEPESTIAVEAITEVFGLVRWDSRGGRGLTDGQVIDILTELAVYLEELKKKRSPGLTSSFPLAGESSNATEPQAETTPSCAGCPDVSTAPKCGEVGGS